MARPRIEIDYDKFAKLCEIQCTQEEIGYVLGCSADTLARAVKRDMNMSYADYYKKHGSVGKIALRRYQFVLAKKNTAMAIWLGKQYLGQRDMPAPPIEEITQGFDVTQIATVVSAD